MEQNQDRRRDEAEDARPALIYRGHAGMIELATWSPVAMVIASCGPQDGVRVWDAITGETLVVYRGHSDLVRDLAFSPDGRLLATCCDDGSVHVWEVATGEPLRVYDGHSRPAISLCWSPDGQRLASADETTVCLWPAVWEPISATGEASLAFGRKHEFIFTAVRWPQDGSRLLTASQGCIGHWDPATGALFGARDYGDTLVAFEPSPDGSRLALANDDALVLVVCGRTGDVLISHRVWLDASWGLAWSPCGRYLASGGYDSAEVWDAQSGATLLTYRGHAGDVSSVAWSPDGRWLVSSGVDGTAHIWAGPTASPQAVVG
jgi:WD40 repeat protein